jgi:hypothetical protein
MALFIRSYLLLLLLLPGGVSAQDPIEVLLNHLNASEPELARHALAESLLLNKNGERFQLLSRSHLLLSDRGEINLWLEAVHDAVEREPKDPLFRYYRGFVLTDLKYLRRAAHDLKVPRKANPNDPYAIDASVRLADRAFDHAAVHALKGVATSDISKQIIARNQLISEDLSSARRRQRFTLFGLIVVSVGLAFVFWRRNRIA